MSLPRIDCGPPSWTLTYRIKGLFSVFGSTKHTATSCEHLRYWSPASVLVCPPGDSGMPSLMWPVTLAPPCLRVLFAKWVKTVVCLLGVEWRLHDLINTLMLQLAMGRQSENALICEIDYGFIIVRIAWSALTKMATVSASYSKEYTDLHCTSMTEMHVV